MVRPPTHRLLQGGGHGADIIASIGKAIGSAANTIIGCTPTPPAAAPEASPIDERLRSDEGSASDSRPTRPVPATTTADRAPTPVGGGMDVPPEMAADWGLTDLEGGDRVGSTAEDCVLRACVLYSSSSRQAGQVRPEVESGAEIEARAEVSGQVRVGAGGTCVCGQGEASACVGGRHVRVWGGRPVRVWAGGGRYGKGGRVGGEGV